VRDKQRAETRRRLYHAALEVFARDGVDSCRIEDIAQRAEVSRAAFYFHFPTKDDVLFELLRESEQPTEEALAALPEGATLQQAYDVFIRGMLEFWQLPERKPLIIDVFAAQMRRLRMLADDREAEPIRALVTRRFQMAAGRGELSPVIPPELLADFFLLNCLTAMASWCVQPVLSLEDTLRGVVMLFMNGASGAPGGS
jgi:AcrR family transcriptional regulator